MKKELNESEDEEEEANNDDDDKCVGRKEIQIEI